MLIRLFGRVSVGGNPISAQKHACMLAILAACPGEPVTSAELMDRIWDGDPPESAINVLYSQVARVRGWLRGHSGEIRRAGGGYVLDVDPDLVDLHYARTLACRAAEAADPAAALEHWRQATMLVEQEALAGVKGQWAEGFRRTMHKERAGWIASRFAGELAAGRHEAVVDSLVVAARAEPFAESIAASLMLALFRCGRAAEALLVFDEMRCRLRDELGADPSTELRDLHRRILDHDPDLAVPTGAVPSLLPAAITSFAGREAELSQLDGCVGDGNATNLVALIGPAGVGKTTLAVQWAHRARDRFPGGQLYLNLRGFDPGGRAMSADDALRALLELLQVPPSRIPSTVEGCAGLYRRMLAGSRTLVVLDNARDSAHVRELLPGSPGSTVVITSRDQLAGLVATDGAQPILLDALGDDQARQLLANRLGMPRIQAEPQAVSHIIAACGGLPLALAIVAARVALRPGFPMAAFAGELADVRGRLDALTGADGATDLRAVFSWSYQALRTPAARAFRLLGLHYGQQIGIDAAASLTGTSPAQIRWLLSELAGAHLLVEQAPGRYAFHDLVRAYAAELAERTDEPADRERALTRLLDHYLHTGLRATVMLNVDRAWIDPPDLRPGGIVTVLPTSADAGMWFRREWKTALATVHHAAARGQHLHCWQMAWAVTDYLERAGRWTEALAANRASLDAAVSLGDQAMQAISHTNVALTFTHLRQYDKAHAHLRETLRVRLSTGDHDGLARSYLGMALVYDRQGLHAEALRHSELALAESVAAGDSARQIGSLNGIAWQNAQLGDYHRCIEFSRRALAVPGEPRNRFRASAWDTLGYAYHRLARYEDAIVGYQNAVKMFQELGIRFHEARSLTKLADSHDALGRHSVADEVRRQALQIFEDLGHPDAEQLRAKLADPH